MTAADAARDLFVAAHDRRPDGIWSGPGRVNLIGEHTDYNEGFVLPFAIQHRTYAAVALTGTDEIRVRSTFAEGEVKAHISDLDGFFPTPAGQVPAVPEWSAYVLGVAWALRMRASDPSTGSGAQGLSSTAQDPDGATRFRGVDIAIASDVPVGAGLSSSAAIEGAVASALNDLWELGLDPVTLAQIGRRAENEAVGAPTGIMDQMSSMLGQPDAATFIDCRSLQTRSIPTGFHDAGLEVLVIDTQVKHAHATGGYGERRASCELGAKLLGIRSLRDASVADLPRAAEVMDEVTFRRVRHIVTENQRVLDTVEALTQRGPRAIGDLLVASHVSMRDDFEISSVELDVAVDTALANSAVGARMTGGGFGGAAIALVAHADLQRVSGAVIAAFAQAGFATPHLFTVEPSEGPRRDA